MIVEERLLPGTFGGAQRFYHVLVVKTPERTYAIKFGHVWEVTAGEQRGSSLASTLPPELGGNK